MKYKLISAATLLLLLCFAFAVSSLGEELLKRSIQHEEESAVMPGVYIETENSSLPVITTTFQSDGLMQQNSSSVNAVISVRENGEEVLCHTAQVSYRGHSSMEFDKKQYKICFTDENGTEDKTVPFLGMEKFDEWALNGSYLDRSLMRNYLCYNIAGQFIPYTPDARYCEVYLNGEYQGLYLAVETVARSSGRVDISAYKNGNNALSYIVCADWNDEGKSAVENIAKSAMIYPEQSSLYVVYPGKEKLTDTYKSAIANNISEFEKALYSQGFADLSNGYRKYIDVDSFFDYFILNEFFQNADAGDYSTYFYKEAKGKLCAGPVWDFNSALGCDVDTDLPYNSFVMTNKPYFKMLMKDSAFVEKVIARYKQLRKTVFSEEYLLDFISDTEAFLGEAIMRNNSLWGSRMYGEEIQKEIKLIPSSRNPDNYDDAVRALCDFIKRRGEFLDEYIDTLRQYSHESAVKKYNR